jgi:hypothetical protein
MLTRVGGRWSASLSGFRLPTKCLGRTQIFAI